jgi:quercetin dioxygenase-like cupin family protein
MGAVEGYEMMATLQTRPYALLPGERQSPQPWGVRISIKAASEQTGGAFNLFEICCPPGYTTPLHIHYAEDVAVYVLEGTLTFFWGNEPKAAVGGSYFFQPRGTPHGFRVEGCAPARFLYLTFPAGLDRLVAAQELYASHSESAAAAARHKIEILGPLHT